MQNQLTIQIATLIFAGLPVSLIIIHILKKILSPYDPALANTTTICTELTGTLTKKDLLIRSLEFYPLSIKVHHKKDQIRVTNNKTNEEIQTGKAYLKKIESLHLAAITMNICEYKKIADIEKLINKFFLESGFGKHKIEHDYERIECLPTNAKKKLSSTVAIRNESKEIFTFTKGNPYAVLEKCTRIQIGDKKINITPQERKKLKNQFKRLNHDGQKLIAFAYKGLPRKRQQKYTESFSETDLIFLGTVGLANPLNTDLKETIQEAKEMGIHTVITTSQRERKARAAGIRLGIVNQNYFEIISGYDLEDMKDTRLQKILSNTDKSYIFARLKPKDKHRLYTELKKQKQVIAIANKEKGQGLKKIVTAIQNERAKKTNAKKFIFHSLSCKIAEVILITIAILLHAPLPLTITTILLLDITINLTLELSLRKSRDTSTKLRKHEFITLGILTGIFVSGVYYFSLMRYGWISNIDITTSTEISSKILTIVFAHLALSQILIAFSLQNNNTKICSKNLFSNQYLILTSIVSGLLIYIFTALLYLAQYTKFGKISTVDWQVIIFATFIFFLIGETQRLFNAKHDKDTEK